MELIPLSRALSQRELLDPIKPAYDRRRPDGRLKLAASAFHRLDRPASSPGNMAYCCAKTRCFFPSGDRNYRQYSSRLPTEG